MRGSFCISFLFSPQLSDQLAPTIRKIETRQREKDRARALKDDEVRTKQDALLQFVADMKELHRLNAAVEEFNKAGKPQQLEEVIAAIEETGVKIQDKKDKLKELQPELESAKAAVDVSKRQLVH